MNVNTSVTKEAGRTRIEKQLLAADFVNGGLATPDRKNRFETHLRGTNDMMGMADIQFTKSGVMRVTVDKEYLGRDVLGAGVENTNFTGIVEPDYQGSNVQLRKLTGGFDISYEAMLENIESKDYVPGLTDRFMQKAAYSISDWVVNANTVTGATAKDLLTDGFHALSDDAYILDAGGSEITRNIFHAGFRTLPKETRRMKSQLKWVANTLLQNNWVEVYGDRATVGGDSATRGQIISPDGIPFLTCDEIRDDLSVGYTSATFGQHTGTRFDTFVLTAASNVFRLTTTIAGAATGPTSLTITPGTYTAPELANALNIAAVAAGHPAVFAAVDGKLRIRATATGPTNSVEIHAIANHMYTVVGMTAALYAGAAANPANTTNNGTFMWLTMPSNFRVYVSEEFRTSWEYVPRRDAYMFTVHFIAAPYLVDAGAMVRVDNIRLKDYR